ncbi:MAG: hypothetical protein ACYCW6_19320, partial [Candidatus Xenobia bacterium]
MNSIGSVRNNTVSPTALPQSPAPSQAQPEVHEEVLLGQTWQPQPGLTVRTLKSLAGPGMGAAAIVTAGVAAGIGVATLFSGPLGALVAGLAGALGFMKNLQLENRKLREENQTLRHRASHDP